MNADGLLVPVEDRTFLISKDDKLPELTNVVGGNLMRIYTAISIKVVLIKVKNSNTSVKGC